MIRVGIRRVFSPWFIVVCRVCFAFCVLCNLNSLVCGLYIRGLAIYVGLCTGSLRGLFSGVYVG